MLRGANGACATFNEDKKVSMYFCAKHMPPNKTVYFIKVDESFAGIPSSRPGHYLVLENEDSDSKMKLMFDDVYFNRTSPGYVVTYMWFVPEVFVKLFREEMRATFRFYIDGKDHVFKLNKEQKDQFRFIANFQSIAVEKE